MKFFITIITFIPLNIPSFTYFFSVAFLTIWTDFCIFLQPFVNKPSFLTTIAYFQALFRPPNFTLNQKYSDKLTPNQLSKPKFIKKLKNKNNTITLKLGGMGVRYINSNLTTKHYKKPQYPVFVSGHWREQPIGRRGLGLTKSIWIKPFFKYESCNNITFNKKVYQVS